MSHPLIIDLSDPFEGHGLAATRVVCSLVLGRFADVSYMDTCELSKWLGHDANRKMFCDWAARQLGDRQIDGRPIMLWPSIDQEILRKLRLPPGAPGFTVAPDYDGQLPDNWRTHTHYFHLEGTGIRHHQVRK